MESTQKCRLAIFGIGMHFQETYSAAFRRNSINSIAEIVWVADLQDRKDLVMERCRIAEQNPLFVGIEKFDDIKLPESIKYKLDKTLADNPVDCFLISTTPEQHRAYVEWAIEKGIDILLDKPLSSRDNAMSDIEAARGIEDDWRSMNDAAQKKNVSIMVNSHRRFHPAYKKVGEILKETAEQTGCGVTMISTFNSDGQWRFPKELRDIQYHGYNTGNGVVSHFGYHYLDIDMYWYRMGTPEKQRADEMIVSSEMLSAQDYAKIIPSAMATNALRNAGQPAVDDDDVSVIKDLDSYGEVDAYVELDLLKNKSKSCHITIQMVHSGFSQRAWTTPAVNLYKENGRVRWENHLIQQGPFQAIEIRSFQAVQPSWKHPDENINRWERGGADHVEINIYRNKILGKPALETINAKDLMEIIPKHDVIHEDIKANVLMYFIVYVAQKKQLPILRKIPQDVTEKVNGLKENGPYDLSLFFTHQATTALMSACYESNAISINKPELSNRISKNIYW